MADLARYVVALEAETAKYRRGLDRANAKLKRFENDQRRSLNNVRRGFDAVAGRIGALVGAATLVRMVQLSDELVTLNQRIKTAVGVTGDFARVQKDLISISVQTGSAFRDTVQTFQRLSRVRDSLGATQQNIIDFTRAVQQLGIIGGSSTDEINRGLIQLSQALNEPIVRTQDFRLILDSMPELAARIADGLGVTVGELTKMVREGRVFSTQVLSSILGQAQDINEQFREMPTTISRGFNSLFNALNQAITKFNEGVSFSQAIGGLAQLAADQILAVSGLLTPLQLAQRELKQLQEELLNTSNRLEELANPQGLDRDIPESVRELRINKLLQERARLIEDIANQRLKLKSLGPFTGFEGVGVDEPVKFDAKAAQRGAKSITTRMDVIVEEFAKRTQRMDEIGDQFVSTFADNMVQAMDGGFKSILRSWVRTLQQMAAKAIASKVFSLISNLIPGPQPFSSTVDTVLSTGNFGGTNPAFDAVVRNLSPVAQAIAPSINIDARGADADADKRLIEASTAIVDASVAKTVELMRRGRV